MPDRRRRRPAAGGVADAVDPHGAERPYRAIFWTVRADGKGDVVRRPALDRRDNGRDRKPEGGDGRAGAVLRGGTGVAGKGAGLILPSSRPSEPSEPSER